MSLIRCPECKHPISIKAEVCPHCGYKPTREDKVKAIDDAVEHPIKTEPQEVVVEEKDDGSAIGGFLLVFFLSLVGLIIALAAGGERTKSGAVACFILHIILGVITGIIIIILFVTKVLPVQPVQRILPVPR